MTNTYDLPENPAGQSHTRYLMTEDIKAIVPKIQKWATAIPWRVRISLYGSRISGTHRPDSDLDVGVEFIDISDWHEMFYINHKNREKFQEELRSLISFPEIHVEFYLSYDPNKPSKAHPTNAASYLIFDSERTPPEMEEARNLETIYRKKCPPCVPCSKVRKRIN